jgi:UDP-N-acetylmuramyl tripeptide synthase
MSPRAVIAILACRFTRLTLRLLKKGGTALPGKVAVKICPDILKHLAKNVNSIVVTGTNGKTTTCRIIEQHFSSSGRSYFSNKSGSNLMQGITAQFVQYSTALGKPRREWAIIECDEAASKKVCEYLNPSVLLVTNIFRDQLDRFGEVSTTRSSVKTGIENSPNAVVFLNADDSLVASVADEIKNRVIFYGVDTSIYSEQVAEPSDATHCIRCKGLYEYDYVTYGHLGAFRCPECGYRRPAPDVSVREILSKTPDSVAASLSVFGGQYDVTIGLPGGYNIYNAVAAAAVTAYLGFSQSEITAALATFECGFGRMEKITLGSSELRIILVKNPSGCNQALNYLLDGKDDFIFSVCLNDKFADGTDVSWIWDADFEKLLSAGDRLKRILVSGIRAEDMAVRLKYAGIDPTRLESVKDYGALLKTISESGLPCCMMPTYTAMLAIREMLSRQRRAKDFWE